MVQLAEHFKSDTDRHHSEWLRQQKWFIKAKTDKAHREELEDDAETALLTTAAVITVATEAEIEAFEAKLNTYDEAIIKALYENRIRMDEVKERLAEADLVLQQLLEHAYVMPDGRHVFLTEDRTQAFDENGVEVSPDELDFNLIGPDRPTWETFQAGKNDRDAIQAELDRLEAERKQILEFQGKVDDARESIANGDVAKDKLDTLDAELAEAMPPSVRNQMSGFESAENAPNLTNNFAAHAFSASALKMDAAINAAPIPELET